MMGLGSILAKYLEFNVMYLQEGCVWVVFFSWYLLNILSSLPCCKADFLRFELLKEVL